VPFDLHDRISDQPRPVAAQFAMIQGAKGLYVHARKALTRLSSAPGERASRGEQLERHEPRLSVARRSTSREFSGARLRSSGARDGIAAAPQRAWACFAAHAPPPADLSDSRPLLFSPHLKNRAYRWREWSSASSFSELRRSHANFESALRCAREREDEQLPLVRPSSWSAELAVPVLAPSRSRPASRVGGPTLRSRISAGS
jgi:hypothetical protein